MSTAYKMTELDHANLAFVDAVQTDFPAFDRPLTWLETTVLEEIGRDLWRIRDKILTLDYARYDRTEDPMAHIIDALDVCLTHEAREILRLSKST